MTTVDPEFLIRRARPADAEDMVALLNPIIEQRKYSALVTPASVETQRAFIETFPERGVFHVAEELATRRVVGMQDLAPFYADSAAFDHVAGIATFVALTHHRRGIAARLFEASFAAAREAGFEKILTFVRADNEAGLRAYLGQGFTKVGTAERLAKIDGRYVDEVIIERFL